MTPEQIEKRMAELLKPIHQQILMTDNPEEVVMLACVMIASARNILDQQFGVQHRIEFFRAYTYPNPLKPGKQ